MERETSATGRCVTLVLATLAAVGLVIGLVPVAAADERGASSTYIVMLRDGDPGDMARMHARKHGSEVQHIYRHALVGYAARMSAPAAARIARDPRVAAVDAAQPVQLDAQTVETGIDRVDGEMSEAVSGDGAGAVDADVAVLDTGIDAADPDLNVVGGTNCNGSGESFDDDIGHGTYVAGIVGARDDAEGVVGVAPGARLWAVRVFDEGWTDTSNVICGIDWVTANADTIEVANMSLSLPGSSSGCADGAMHTAICNSVAAGVTYTVSAGNLSQDSGTGATSRMPASFEEVITVSALADFDGKPGGLVTEAPACSKYDENAEDEVDDTFADFSNYGRHVDLIAPGVCIVSNWIDGFYARSSGTSAAAPHAAGAAALVKARNPSASPNEVKVLLQTTGTMDWDHRDDGDPIKEPLLNVADLDPDHQFEGSLSIDDVSVTEGHTGNVPAVFNVSLSLPSALPVTVDYLTIDSTATAADYTAAAGTVSFAPGETAKTVTVEVSGDRVHEPAETFTMSLWNPVGASIADSQGTGTILDDDTPPSLSVSDATVTEGDGSDDVVFSVTLSEPWDVPVSVDYATADGTATAPDDYTAATASLSFAPGETAKNVAVSVRGDTLDEADETFSLNLSAPVGATLARAQGVGTIIDDDDPRTSTGGTPLSWGLNDNGQLGDGTTTSRAAPGPVSGLTDVVAVEGGWGFHTLAVRSDGTVWGWGYNGDGQLGDGTRTSRTTPVQVVGITDAVAACAGYEHSVILRADGTLWGMGDGWGGALGPDYHEFRTPQVPTTVDEPVQLPGYSDIVDVDCGGWHNVALRSDGTLLTSGYNGAGELGDGTTNPGFMPIEVLDGVVAMSAGLEHTLAVRSDGTVWGWGWNASGQTGNGVTSPSQPTPSQVPGVSGITAVAGGSDHSLALGSDGTVFAWGDNSSGQLGTGTTRTWQDPKTTTPVQVSELDSVTSIAAGGWHNLAIRADGTAWAWGGNWRGQAGAPSTTSSQPSPVQVPGMSGVTAVSGGGENSFAVSAS